MQSADKHVLSHVSLCESQPSNGTADKKYVQDALQERGREVGFFLVCRKFSSVNCNF